MSRKALLGVALALFVLAVMAITIAKNASASHTAAPAAPTINVVANPDIDLGSPAGDIAAPGFRLLDQRGQPTTLAQFRGKVVVMAFVDSHCTTICPLTTASMVQALDLLGPAADQVQLIGINANPLATGVADVAGYTRAHGLEDMDGRWRFLTGSLAQLEQVWRGYGVYVAAVHNDIDHQPIMVLIDGAGRERTIYSSRMSYEGVAPQARVLAAGIARLLPAGGSAAAPPLTPAALDFVPPLTPSAWGAGQPHLVVFFARWLDSSPDLAAHLASLDAYARAARSAGWPAPVAVDETTTEAANAPAVGSAIPVIADASGRLADGFQVQDLPWYALTSPTGTIVWSHDGWLSAPALDRNVRTALVRH